MSMFARILMNQSRTTSLSAQRCMRNFATDSMAANKKVREGMFHKDIGTPDKEHFLKNQMPLYIIPLLGIVGLVNLAGVSKIGKDVATHPEITIDPEQRRKIDYLENDKKKEDAIKFNRQLSRRGPFEDPKAFLGIKPSVSEEHIAQPGTQVTVTQD